MQQTSYGTLTITDTTDIARVQNWYLASSSSFGVKKTDSGWTTDVTNANATMTATKQYLWNYEQVQGEGANGNYITISTTDPVIIGRYGQNGGTGDPGRGITSIDEYYQVTNSTSKPGSSGWQKNTLVTPTATKRYLWNYQVINYINPTSTQGSYEDARIIGVYGDKGETGTSVTNINSSKSGDETTITISMSDGTSKQFTVKDGAQGDTGATAQWYYGTDLSHTSGTATLAISKTSDVVVGSMYLNPDTSLCYRCTAISDSDATWTYAGDLTTGVINNIEIGGRNYLRNTGSYKDILISTASNTTILEDDDGFSYARIAPTAVGWHYVEFYPFIPADILSGKTVTVSAYIRCGDLSSSTSNDFYLTLLAHKPSTKGSRSGNKDAPFSLSGLTANEWTRITYTRTINYNDWSVQSGFTRDDFNYISLAFYNHTAKTIDIKMVKLEIGNTPTDWTPAPEDAEAAIGEMQTSFITSSRDITALIERKTEDTNKTLEEQLALIQARLDEIKLQVSSTAKNRNFIASSGLSNSYTTEEPPTLLNYPTYTDFFDWPICNTNIYCSNSAICGTNRYSSHENNLAHCTSNDSYYIFKKDAADEYYWDELTLEEFQANSEKYSVISITEDQISIISALNSDLTELLISYEGVKTTPGKLYCC